MRITRSLYSLLYKQAIEECSERLTLTSAPTKSAGKHLVIFDLDETFFSRNVRGIGKIQWVFEKNAVNADCRTRHEYYWINKLAWQATAPSLLFHHDIVLLSETPHHDEHQIKDTLNTLFSGFQRYHGINFSKVPYFDLGILSDRRIPMGEKIAALSTTSVFSRYPFQQMLLVDDQQSHLDSAANLGIKTIRAGEPNYFHLLNAMLDLGVVLPAYDSYEIAPGVHTHSVKNYRR